MSDGEIAVDDYVVLFVQRKYYVGRVIEISESKFGLPRQESSTSMMYVVSVGGDTYSVPAENVEERFDTKEPATRYANNPDADPDMLKRIQELETKNEDLNGGVGDILSKLNAADKRLNAIRTTSKRASDDLTQAQQRVDEARELAETILTQ